MSNEPILLRIKNEATLAERKRILDILENFKDDKGFHQPLWENESMNCYWLSDSTMKKILEGE
ncbi:MAG: hypothetical protein WC389_19785 [Lutibacter sp.]|jgi:hypothetical protein